MAELTHAHNADFSVEFSVGKMARQIDGHAATGATGQTKSDQHGRGMLGFAHVGGKTRQCAVQLALAGVVINRIDAFGDRARNVATLLRHRIVLGQIAQGVR